MRYLGRSLGVLAVLAGLFVTGDLLYEGIAILLSRHHLAYEPPSLRPLRLPCGEAANLRGTERQVQVSGRPGSATIALQLILPAGHPCARSAFSGELDRKLPAFVTAAFGSIEVGGRKLSRKDLGPLLIRREPLAPSAVIRVEARLPFEDRLFLHIGRPEEPIPPAVDRISVLWDERLRVESISPEPDFKSDRQLSKEIKRASIRWIHLGLEVLESGQASYFRGETRRAMLQRVNDAVHLPVAFTLLISLTLALPMLLSLPRLQSGACSSYDAGQLVDATAALLTFHFATYLFSSAYGIRSIAGFSTVEETVTGWLRTISPEGPISSPGQGIYLVAVAVFGLAIPVLIRQRIARSCPLRRARLAWIAWSPVLLTAAAAVWVGGRQMIGKPFRLLEDPHLLMTIGLGFLLLALLLVCFLRLLAGIRIPAGLAPVCAGSALIFMTAEIVLERSGAYSLFWLIVTGILGAFLIYRLAAIGSFLSDGVIERPAWLNGREVQLLMSLLLFLAALPTNLLSSSRVHFAGHYSISNLTVFLAPWILPIWLIGILVFLNRQGRQGQEISDLARSLGLLATAAVLYSPRTTWLYIPVTFLLGWLTLDRVLVQKADGELSKRISLAIRQRVALLASALDINAAEQALRGYRRKQMKAMILGEVDFSTYQRGRGSRVTQLERLRRQAKIHGKDASELALSVGPFPSAWKNGVHGAFYATLFASPWLLLGIADLLRAPGYNTPHPLWDFFLDVVLLCLRWVAIGFLLGYFFPYLRGQSGLGKGFYLFLGIILPTLPAAAIFDSSAQQWQVILFSCLQMFIHCMLLGMFAFDREVLRQAGHRDWRLLFEVQGLPMVGISLSSLAIAIGTAITTLLTSQITGLVGAALRFALPQAPEFPIPK